MRYEFDVNDPLEAEKSGLRIMIDPEDISGIVEDREFDEHAGSEKEMIDVFDSLVSNSELVVKPVTNITNDI